MRLLYFNPENDLALASNDPHYTPPASARQMARDLSDFSKYWAEPDDLILRSDGTLVDAQGRPSNESLSILHYPSSLLPWGWSPLTVRQLDEMGIPCTVLPTEKQLAEYRAFASRRTAVFLLENFRKISPRYFSEKHLVGESTWCCSEEAVWQTCGCYGASMLKMPWSGSGRGVHPVQATGPGEKDVAWVRRTLERQGGVEVEPIYNKVLDFAMEFWADDGQVRYEGLSVFETTAGGVYAGNLVASEEEKERRLTAYVNEGLLQEVREQLVVLLNDASLPSWYTGPLGVDLMIVAQDSRHSSCNVFSIHPLVEINLRMTMGWVVLHLQRKLNEGEVGTFKITHSEGHYRAIFSKISR